MPAHPGKKNTSRLRCSSYNFPTKVGHNDIIQQVFEPLNTSEREPHITLAQTMWILNGCIYYSDRGKDRMSVWKTAMIFFGQMQGKTPHSKWRHPVFPFITTVRMTSFLRFRLWLCGMCGELCILATTDRMTTKQMPKPLRSPNPLDSSRKVSFSPCHPYPSA